MHRTPYAVYLFVDSAVVHIGVGPLFFLIAPDLVISFLLISIFIFVSSISLWQSMEFSLSNCGLSNVLLSGKVKHVSSSKSMIVLNHIYKS